MTSRSLGHRAPLLWLVVPMMAGLVLGRAIEGVPVFWPLGLALAAAVLAIVGGARKAWFAAPMLVVAMLFAGIASYALHRARIAAWDALPPREARLELRIDRTFPQADAKKTSGLATIVAAEEHLKELRGQRLYFSLALRPGEPLPARSAVVRVVGVLVTLPRNPPVDTFDGYLAGAGMNFRLTRGRIDATVRDASGYQRFRSRALARLAEILGAGVDEKRPELAAVLRAMLLGQKHELSDEHDTLFMRSGTMHLFAISGLHIGVIAVSLHALLSVLRLPRWLRYASALSALWLYVDITGGTPSAVRAFIMVAFVETAILFRVPNNPLSALAASAMIVVLLWPMQVFSASFQMSYGIVAALLLLGLPLADAGVERWTPFRLLPKPTWCWHHRAIDGLYRKIIAAVAIGLASTLVSAVSGVLFFKLFTPAALLANLVLIPAASFVIVGGFASLVCGLVGATLLSALFNHATVVVLWAIDASVRGVVSMPGAWHVAQFAAPWIGPGSLVTLLAALAFGYATGWRRARGGWWPPFAIVALTLIFGVNYG